MICYPEVQEHPPWGTWGADLWGSRGRYSSLVSPLWMLSQVTEISNVKCVTRLPKETKRQAVAIIFTDDSARTFTCDSGEALGHSLHLVFLDWLWSVVRPQDRAGLTWGCGVSEGAGPRIEVGRQVAWPCPPCLAWWDN